MRATWLWVNRGRLTRALAEVQAWLDTSAQNARNTEYYRGLIGEAAEHLKPEMFTRDDNTHTSTPLACLLPQAVKGLKDKVLILGRIDEQKDKKIFYLRSRIEYLEGRAAERTADYNRRAAVSDDRIRKLKSTCDFIQERLVEVERENEKLKAGETQKAAKAEGSVFEEFKPASREAVNGLGLAPTVREVRLNDEMCVTVRYPVGTGKLHWEVIGGRTSTRGGSGK